MSSASSAERFRSLSPAEFFYRNKEIAGFSNPTRALYQTVRELVENALDACDVHGILPRISVSITVEDRELSHYRVTVSDNGIGIPPQYVPQAFGQVLFGSKYTLRQSRGTFGLGAKMAILYGQITTGKPVEVTTSYRGSKLRYYFKILIDIEKNKPLVLERRVRRLLKPRWGTKVSLVVEGDWGRARNRILEYIRRTAMGTPYATITFMTPEGEVIRYERTVRKLPPPPKEVKPHPYGVDVEVLKSLIALKGDGTLLEFLATSFQGVGLTTAKAFLASIGFDPNRSPKSLSIDEITYLAKALKEYPHFRPPRKDALSPLGEDVIKAGLESVLKPEFVTAVTRRPQAYGGHPFIVEVGIAYGGDVPLSSPKAPTLYRFANKMPLLYDEGSDVMWKVVSEQINWSMYRVKLPDKVAVLIHICSTKVPYKGVGKESVAEVPEIEREIRNAVRDAARKLKVYLARRQRAEEELRKVLTLVKYIPEVALSLSILSRPPHGGNSYVSAEELKERLLRIVERRASKIKELCLDLRKVKVLVEQ